MSCAPTFIQVWASIHHVRQRIHHVRQRIHQVRQHIHMCANIYTCAPTYITCAPTFLHVYMCTNIYCVCANIYCMCANIYTVRCGGCVESESCVNKPWIYTRGWTAHTHNFNSLKTALNTRFIRQKTYPHVHEHVGNTVWCGRCDESKRFTKKETYTMVSRKQVRTGRRTEQPAGRFVAKFHIQKKTMSASQRATHKHKRSRRTRATSKQTWSGK